jgi:uncharacterized protein (TIGR02246 family)
MRVVALVVAVVLVALPRFIPAQTPRDPVLDKLSAQFAAAYNAHDAAKVASFYADDAMLMIPDEPMIKGRSSIEAYFREQFAQGPVTLRTAPLESAVAGDRAFQVGSATATLGPWSDHGKYITIYKRVGREWKIAYDIFNSDQPEPTAANPDIKA